MEATMIIEIYLLFKGFLNQLKKDSISAFAAQAAFFLILSITPLCSLLLTLVRFLPITESTVVQALMTVVPPSLEPVISTVIWELFNQGSSTLISISALVAIWSAGKAIMAIISGLNSVYHVTEKRNYVLLRIISALYTIVLIAAFLITLILIVFGNALYDVFKKYMPLVSDIIGIFIDNKILLTIGFLIILFIFLYRLVPNNSSILFTIPGAVFSSVGWVVFSYLFSIYIDKFTHYSYTYGSLSAIGLVMLWIYICMYIVFIGAEINQYFRIHFQLLYQSLQKKRTDK